MPKRPKKNELPGDEDELKRQEELDGILSEPIEKKHPHEIIRPVGEDQRDYEEEELEEQGWTEEGNLGTPTNDDDANPRPPEGRKIA